MVDDRHGPVYEILLRGWESFAGDSVFALRFSTVLFSIISIALLYRLGRELFSPAAGVLAALIFTLMDKQVVLTQEVRGYPLLFLTMIAITFCYVRWRRHPNSGYGFGFVAFSIFGLYLHYFSAMINLAILAHGLLTMRERRNLIALNGLIGLAFLPWVFIVIHQNVYTPQHDDFLQSFYSLPSTAARLNILPKSHLVRRWRLTVC